MHILANAFKVSCAVAYSSVTWLGEKIRSMTTINGVPFLCAENHGELFMTVFSSDAKDIENVLPYIISGYHSQAST